MHDSQNSSRNKNEQATANDEQSLPDETVPPKKSYYYDDSTGYEIYDEESEDENQDNCKGNPDSQ